MLGGIVQVENEESEENRGWIKVNKAGRGRENLEKEKVR